MKRIVLSLTLSILSIFSFWAQSGYNNPVLSGFYPDPSVCRVDSDYYLVNSSFEFFPGVPLFHSKDLIHWDQIGYCLNRKSQLPLESAGASGGIYAPTIRYHDGVFYMITTNVTDKGNFYVTTTDPHGEWSEPIWLEQGGIDPTLFFDEGRCYLISNPDNTITIGEIDVKTGKPLSQPRGIWQGTGGRYPEGPHIYKKDGWYYLLISEGGTEYGHKVTIARSKTLYGPYESNPGNPILTHMNMNAQMNPIQGTGHADFVQAHDGSWWVVFLGFRPQWGNHHLLGRETFLAPMEWNENEWPIINGGEPIETVMNCATLPQTTVPETTQRDEFDTSHPQISWNYLRNPDSTRYSQTIREGFLRLQCDTIGLDEVASPVWLGKRQQHICFDAETCLETRGLKSGDRAGITVYRRDSYHYDLYVTQRDGQFLLEVGYSLESLRFRETVVTLSSDRVYLKVEGNAGYYRLLYSTDGIRYETAAVYNSRFLSTETVGGFTGTYLALFAGSNQPTGGYADFDWFDYQECSR